MSQVPSDSDAVTQWLAELDDPAKRERAAARLWAKYRGELERRVAARISQEFKGKFGPDSVVQGVFASFFERQRVGGFRKLQDRKDLHGLLVDMAFKKTVGRIRWFSTLTRSPDAGGNDVEVDRPSEAADSHAPSSDAPRERQLRDHHRLESGKKVGEQEPIRRRYRASHPVSPEVEDDSGFDRGLLELFLADAEPHILAEVKDQLAQLSEEQQRLFALDVLSCTDEEIAGCLNMEPGAVRRKREIIAAKWQPESK